MTIIWLLTVECCCVQVNCGVPKSPANGSLGDYKHTRKGSKVSFYCNPGFAPSGVETAVCTYSKRWIPPPEEHICVSGQFKIPQASNYTKSVDKGGGGGGWGAGTTTMSTTPK